MTNDAAPSDALPDDSRLEAFVDVQRLDWVPRTGYRLRGVREPESISEHSWHVCFLVFALARHVPGLDRARALEMALIHDLAELRIGDLTPDATRFLGKDNKRESEAEALAELGRQLGVSMGDLGREAAEKRSLEARFVHLCDVTQLGLKVLAYQRARNGDLTELRTNTAARLEEFTEDEQFAGVRPLISQLIERLRSAGSP